MVRGFEDELLDAHRKRVWQGLARRYTLELSSRLLIDFARPIVKANARARSGCGIYEIDGWESGSPRSDARLPKPTGE
jgi:hypothetical protein